VRSLVGCLLCAFGVRPVRLRPLVDGPCPSLVEVGQYGDVILPFTILRRLDCILEQQAMRVARPADHGCGPGKTGIRIKVR
jgi:hypothetical protein